MKKNDKDTNLSNFDKFSKEYLETDKIKTTNINILLNRVRLDQKKSFQKKIILFTLISLIISSIVIFFI